MKNVASMYLRLSRDDGEEAESNSISNQRSLIQAYCKANGIKIYGEYVDDGISGATFDRPSFQKMIADLKSGKFDTVVVKDLSRFGRDYIESGKYIQKIFPEHDVRFISINDNYDSARADANDTHLILPIRNFINDSYCRDISMKVKSSQKTKRLNGEFIGAFAPFGYRKNPRDKHQLVVDGNVRHIVEKIFAMKIEGYSSNAIAKFLNEIGTVTPAKHKEHQGEESPGFIGMKNHWDAKMINRILTNPVYIGTLEQGKVSKLNYKSKKRITLSEEDWVCIPNAHEAIVSEQDFRIAGELLLRDVKQSRGTPGLLSGLLFCKDCGAQLVKRSVHYRGKVTNFYICGNYNAHHTCSRHSIKEETVLGVLKTLILDYLDLNRVLSEKLRHMDFSELHFEAEFTSLEQEKKKYETLRQSLFMDLEDSLINEDEFQRFRANYAAKIRELEAQIEAKKALVKDIRERLLSEESLLQTGTFSADEILSRSLLVHLVNRINIGEGNEIEVEFYDDEKLAILQRILAQEEKRKQEKIISLVPFYSDGKVAAHA